jgi:hypothetical protein
MRRNVHAYFFNLLLFIVPTTMVFSYLSVLMWHSTQAELVAQFLCCIPLDAVEVVLSWLRPMLPEQEQAQLLSQVPASERCIFENNGIIKVIGLSKSHGSRILHFCTLQIVSAIWHALHLRVVSSGNLQQNVGAKEVQHIHHISNFFRHKHG